MIDYHMEVGKCFYKRNSSFFSTNPRAPWKDFMEMSRICFVFLNPVYMLSVKKTLRVCCYRKIINNCVV